MATLTATTTPTSFQAGNPHSEAKRGVRSDLVYWKRLNEPFEPLDFTIPGTEKRYDELSKLDESHEILIHDVRGEEATFTLDRNGFQYVQHKVKELDSCENEDQIKETLLPATEELVKQVLVLPFPSLNDLN